MATRGLQSFGRAAHEVAPGARCAVNLQGIARDEALRGALLTRPGAVSVTEVVDVALRWLPDAPPLGPKRVVASGSPAIDRVSNRGTQ